MVTEDRNFIYDSPIIRNIRLYCRRIKAHFQNILCRLVTIAFPPKRATDNEYYVTVCAIFKNEASSLKEWIEYHRIVGVEHFFLYNNFSTDDYQNVLDPYIEENIVTLIDWPIDKGQIPAYKHFWATNRRKSRWVLLIDIDEFVCPYKISLFSTWLKKFEKYPAVMMYWKMFGTSGKIDHNESKLVTEQYTVCWDKMISIGKVVINTDWEIDLDTISMHLVQFKHKVLGKNILVPTINEFGQFIRSNDFHSVKRNGFTIQINHYWSKAYNDMIDRKFKRGDAVFGDLKPTRNLDTFFANEYRNIASDYKIFRFLIKLKVALGMDRACSDE